MAENQEEQTTLQNEDLGLGMRDPKLISLSKVGFRREGEHILVELEYYVKGVEVVTEKADSGNTLNKILPEVYSKHSVEIPLYRFQKNGEDIYKAYLNIIGMFKDSLYEFHGFSGEAGYKDAIQRRINEVKEAGGNEVNSIEKQGKAL